MFPEVYSRGQAYWATGLTAPSQKHNAILCLGHYLRYGDEQAGVRALPGIARADERAAVIEAWLREHHCCHFQKSLSQNFKSAVQRCNANGRLF
jgi:hypothetical protein